MRLAAFLGVAAVICYAALIYLILRDGGAISGPQAALDLRASGYSAAEARAWLDGMGAAERDTYFGILGLVDTVFPVLFGAALAVFLWQLGGKWTILCPVAYAIFDLSENATIRSLPEAENFADMVRMASDLTTYKFAALGFTAVALVWAYNTRKVL